MDCLVGDVSVPAFERRPAQPRQAGAGTLPPVYEAVAVCGKGAEITRFKGLGEISPSEFKGFIAENMRLDPVLIDNNQSLAEMLQFYMGKNTPDRQQFIIENLKVELDIVDTEVGEPAA